jgi:hypothetical protein
VTGYNRCRLSSERARTRQGSVASIIENEARRAYGQILDSALQKVSKKAVKGGKLFPADSIIFSTSATIGEHALIKVPYLSNQRFTNLSLKSSYSDKFEIKFLFYYSFLLCEWCKNNTRMSSFSTVSGQLPLHQNSTTGRDSSGIVFCVRLVRRLARLLARRLVWRKGPE